MVSDCLFQFREEKFNHERERRMLEMSSSESLSSLHLKKATNSLFLSDQSIPFLLQGTEKKMTSKKCRKRWGWEKDEMAEDYYMFLSPAFFLLHLPISYSSTSSNKREPIGFKCSWVCDEKMPHDLEFNWTKIHTCCDEKNKTSPMSGGSEEEAVLPLLFQLPSLCP